MGGKDSCPNCGEIIKDSGFKANPLISPGRIEIINQFTDKSAESYCKKCGNPLFDGVIKELGDKVDTNNKYLRDNIGELPIISLNTPLKWNYSVLGMVTGHSTTGTGVFTGFTSSFADFFGAQSQVYNEKIMSGEKIAMAQARLKTLEMGGNAIIATNIDYTEVGDGKGMLMVCIYGTAVKLKNTDVLGADLKKLTAAVKENRVLSEILLKVSAWASL